jgi:hypothetical protein
MVWAGLKFGLGFCLGTGVFTALVMVAICFSSWISRLLETRKRNPHREERAPKGGEWKRISISAPREDGRVHSFSFCSVIRWEDREDQKPVVLALADSRSIRFDARKSVRPLGKWPDTTKMVAELRKTRARTLAFATMTEADLRSHFFTHIVFGDLDCYQWLVVLSQHGNRHALQIEQIKADRAYHSEWSIISRHAVTLG